MISSRKKIGLAVYFLGRDKRYASVEAEVKGSMITILASQEIDSLDKFKSKSEVILAYSSPTVLSVSTEETTPEKALNELIPGANSEDFFIQKSTYSRSTYEFVNKKELETLLAELADSGVYPSQIILEKVSLGVLSHNLSSDVQGVEHHIKEDGSFMPADKSSSSTVEIDGQELSPVKLIAFGAILGQQDETLEEWNPTASLSKNREESQGKRQLKLATIICVSVLLLVSVANLFFFQKYSDELASVDQRLYSSNASQERLSALKDQVAIQDKLLASLNTIHPKAGAYFLDQLASSVPEQISLKYMGLENPLKLKARKKIEFRPNELTIEGKTVSTIALNNWIEFIDEMSGVTDVSLLSYEDSKENRGKFVLKVNLEDA